MFLKPSALPRNCVCVLLRVLFFKYFVRNKFPGFTTVYGKNLKIENTPRIKGGRWLFLYDHLVNNIDTNT